VIFIGAESICNATEREFEGHAAAISERVREASSVFGVSLPVYVLIAKMDRLPGFLEIFEDVNEQERRCALGIGLGSRSLDTDPGQVAVDRLQVWLRQVEQRIQERLVRERNRARVDALLGFSGSVNSLAKRIGRLAGRIANAVDNENQVDLRGIFFCSALQTGEFIDRIAAAFGAGFTQAKPEDEFHASAGRAYFVEGVFRDVAFAEQALAGTNAFALRAANRRVRFAMVAVVVGIGLALAVLSTSFLRNRALLADAWSATVPGASSTSGTAVSSTDTALGVAALEEIARVRAVVQPIARDVPLSYRAGLSQSPAVNASANDAFLRVVQEGLAPYVARLIEAAILDPGLDVAVRFELLKSYLMLGGRAQVPVDPELVGASAALLVSRVPGVGADMSATATRHLSDAMRNGLQPLALSDVVVERARASLGRDVRTLLGALAEERIVREFERAGPAGGFSLAEALGPQGGLAFDFDRTLEVPAALTSVGAQYFDSRIDAVAGELAGELWVLGADSTVAAAGQSQIRDAAVRSYVGRYAETWERVLSNPRVKASGGDQLRVFANTVAGSGSPVLQFLRAVEPHLAINPAQPSQLPAQVAAPASTQPQSAAAERLLAMSAGSQPATTAAAPGLSATAEIRKRFRDLISMVEGSSQPSLVTLSGTLGQIAAELGSASERDLLLALTGDPSLQALGTLQSIREMQRMAGQYPEPVQGWLVVALQGARASVGAEAVASVSLAASQQLSGNCPADLLGRYPLSIHSVDEAAPAELARVLGPSGFFHTYFEGELASNVDRSGSTWKFRSGRSMFKGVSESGLQNFRKAEEAAARLGLEGGSPGFRVRARVVQLAANALTVNVSLGGVQFSHSHGPIREHAIDWTPGSEADFKVAFSGVRANEGGVTLAGRWSLFRAIDRYGRIAGPGRIELVVQDGTFDAVIELQSEQLHALFSDQSWRSIRCPA
jgi:type VI secretion system protein ImpL